MKVEKALFFLKDIVCRNATSCADQLAKAILMAKGGEIEQAEPVTVGVEEAGDLRKIAFVAGVSGDLDGLETVFTVSRTEGAQALYNLGDLTGERQSDDAVIEFAVREKIRSIQGPLDRSLSLGAEIHLNESHGDANPTLRQINRDRLLLIPLIRTFNLGDRHGVVFHGGFIQDLPGFSDFGPYATEVLTVCNLSDYLRDESVVPALEAMTSQFSASIVIFGQTGEWKHVRFGGFDLISVGSLKSGECYQYALIKWENDELDVQFRTARMEIIEKDTICEQSGC
jgi:hypothetical protein